jgi:hypothetical protein
LPRLKFAERRGSYIGFGAIIGAVGSIAGSLIGGLTSGGGGGGGGPNMGQYSSRLNEAANQYILPFTDPNKWSLDIPAMASQSIDFGIREAPYINYENMQQLQSLLGQAMPGYQSFFSGLQGTFGQMGDIWNQMRPNVTSMLAGQVPQDVQDQIRRNAAFTSLMGGSAGAGTGATGAITARDLGLTSLDLTEKGQAMAGNLLTSGGNLLTSGTGLLGFARNYLMPQPVNPMSLLPLSDLISGAEWSKSAVFQANEAAYTAKANAAAADIGAPSQSLAGTAGGITGGLQSLFQQGPSGKSPIESLLRMFGGGGGGGGTTTVGGNIFPTGASGLLNTSADPNPDFAFF